MRLILYSKPGCHLCEGLQEKLNQISPGLGVELEIRDITTRSEWFESYQYEVPVLALAVDAATESGLGSLGGREVPLPRPSPRASVQQVKQMLLPHLQKYRLTPPK
jgi:glutaredoxin